MDTSGRRRWRCNENKRKSEKNIEEATHCYGTEKGYWWKYLLAFLIIAIYLIPLYVLFMQSLKACQMDPQHWDFRRCGE